MRIDKYLWCVRYFKTRNTAAEAIKKGHISVNNQTAKPSKEVFASDVILLRKDQINYKILVLDIPQNRVGPKLVDMYRKDETPEEEFERFKLLQLAKDHYRSKGDGRPTKKERRDIDNYTNDFIDDETE
jgi:ribosome-associated heat shock protein Hsp15